MSRKEIPTTDLEDFALSGEEPTPEFRLHLFRQISAWFYHGVVLMACSFKRKQGQQPHHDKLTCLLAAGEVAERLGVNPERVYELARSGELRQVRLGERQTRFRKEDVDDYIRQNTS